MGPLEPGNHVAATDGTVTRELTTIDIDVEIDPFENVLSGHSPADTHIALDPPEGWEGNGYCRRNLHTETGGAFSVDFDDPVTDLENPGCSPTWDFVPGNAVKLTANRDDGHNGQTASIDIVVDFTDDDGSVFEADITWLAMEGITKGCNPPVNDMPRTTTQRRVGRLLGLRVMGPDRLHSLPTGGSVFQTSRNVRKGRPQLLRLRPLCMNHGRSQRGARGTGRCRLHGPRRGLYVEIR